MSAGSIAVDLTIHPLEVVLRACHAFTGRCHVSPRREGKETLVVDLAPFDESIPFARLAGEFSNELLDQHLRMRIAEQTRAIRELLVAQAFCEADLLDRRDSESDEHDDPRGIAR